MAAGRPPSAPAVPGDPAADDYRAAVLVWRVARFFKLTDDPDLADELARDPDRDHHRLEQLLAAGCPLDLAVRIC